MGVNSIGSFIKRLRLSDPFNYKVPLLISFPYLLLYITHTPFERSALLIVASLITCLGFAGFGYSTNDWSDLEKDRLAGKPNAFEGLSQTERFLITTLFVVLAIVPWFYLPFTQFTMLLIVAELLLFFVYAFPPFRLKERGFWGVVADALYAQALPAFFASYTFYLLSKQANAEMVWLIILVSVWQLIAGLRNIIIHQLDDEKHDKASGTKTFVISTGHRQASFYMKLLVGIEMIFYLVFLAATAWFSGGNLAVIYLVAYGVLFYVNGQGLRMITDVKKFAYKVLDDFYLECIPVCMLVLLSVNDYRFLLLLLLHILIFPKNIATRLLRYVFGK